MQLRKAKVNAPNPLPSSLLWHHLEEADLQIANDTDNKGYGLPGLTDDH